MMAQNQWYTMRGHALSVVGQGTAREKTDYDASGVVKLGGRRNTTMIQQWDDILNEAITMLFRIAVTLIMLGLAGGAVFGIIWSVTRLIGGLI